MVEMFQENLHVACGYWRTEVNHDYIMVHYNFKNRAVAGLQALGCRFPACQRCEKARMARDEGLMDPKELICDADNDRPVMKPENGVLVWAVSGANIRMFLSPGKGRTGESMGVEAHGITSSLAALPG